MIRSFATWPATRARWILPTGAWLILVITLAGANPASASPQPHDSAASQRDASAPADQPQRGPTDAQAVARHDARAVAWLYALQKQASSTRTLQARFRYDRIQGLFNQRTRRFGSVRFHAGPPARFHVHMDRLLTDSGRMEKLDHHYIFDGRWLAEQLNDQKVFRRYQIARADQDVAQVDPLAQGRGPFVLPIKPDAAYLLKRFIVKAGSPDLPEPPPDAQPRAEQAAGTDAAADGQAGSVQPAGEAPASSADGSAQGDADGDGSEVDQAADDAACEALADGPADHQADGDEPAREHGVSDRGDQADVDAATGQAIASDPADAPWVHLKLLPRPGREMPFEFIELWFDRELGVPMRLIQVKDQQVGDRSEVTLLKVNRNVAVKADVFDTSPPGRGWQVEIVPLDP